MTTEPAAGATGRPSPHDGLDREARIGTENSTELPRLHDPEPDTPWWFVLLGFGLLVVGCIVSLGGSGVAGLVALVFVALGALLGSIGCIAVGVEMALTRRDWLDRHAAARAARASRDTTSEPSDP